jgi:hypothetical protein
LPPTCGLSTFAATLFATFSVQALSGYPDLGLRLMRYELVVRVDYKETRIHGTARLTVHGERGGTLDDFVRTAEEVAPRSWPPSTGRPTGELEQCASQGKLPRLLDPPLTEVLLP